jgi:hypothetical protein
MGNKPIIFPDPNFMILTAEHMQCIKNADGRYITLKETDMSDCKKRGGPEHMQCAIYYDIVRKAVCIFVYHKLTALYWDVTEHGLHSNAFALYSLSNHKFWCHVCNALAMLITDPPVPDINETIMHIHAVLLKRMPFDHTNAI